MARMYETGRRAFLAQSMCPPRLDWQGSRLPNSSEDFEQDLPTSALPDDISQLSGTWFRIKSNDCYQNPSLILVEKVVQRDDLASQSSNDQCRSHVTSARKSKIRGKHPACKTTPEDHLKEKPTGSNHNKKPYSRPWWVKRKQTTFRTKELEQDEKTDCRLSGAVRSDTGAAMCICEGLQNDGLGRVPPEADSLAVIRRVELDAEGFFSLLFSDRWEDGCLLRVVRGNLLNDIIIALNQLRNSHEVISTSTTAYIRHQTPLKSCNRTPATDFCSQLMPAEVEEKLLVELECFTPQLRIQGLTQQPAMLDPSCAPMSPLQMTDPLGGVASPAQVGGPPFASTSHCSELPGVLSFQALLQLKPLMSTSQSVAASTSCVPSSSHMQDPLEVANSCQSVMSQSHSEDSMEVLPSQSVRLDPSAVSLQHKNISDAAPLVACQSITAVPSRSATAGIRCNIRGQTRPPPHSDCYSPYHEIREPFQLNCYRQQLPFTPHTMPKLSVQKQTRSDSDDDDDAFLGPKYEDSTEQVMSDVFLTPIPKELKEAQSSSKIKQSKKKSSKQKKQAKKKKDKKIENITEAAQHDISDDDSDMEDNQFRSYIDPTRVEKLKRDLELMNTELMARQTAPRKARVTILSRLKNELRIRQYARCMKRERQKTAKQLARAVVREATQQPEAGPSVSTKHERHKTAKQLARAVVCETAQQPEAGPSIPQMLPTDLPPLMTQWPRCPSFKEFYYYLEREKEEGAKKESCHSKTASNKLSHSAKSMKKSVKKENSSASKQSDHTDMERKKSTDLYAEPNSVAGSTAKKSSMKTESKKEKANKKTGSQTQEHEATGKREIKNQHISSGSGQWKITKTNKQSTEESPYVYICDSEIPDSVTQDELFEIMQVDRHFDTHKLKRSYSFERPIARRTDRIQSYSKQLDSCSKPFNKKISKANQMTIPKKYSRKKSDSLQPAETESATDEMAPESPVHEPSSPPMTPGELRDSEFLQYEKYIPKLIRTPDFPVPYRVFNISQLLILAMQIFVVRKERATAYNCYQCRGKLSVTFSKPAVANSWLGAPPLRQPCSFIPHSDA